MTTSPTQLRVYHDGSCPICTAETQELAAADVHGRLQLIDCATRGFTDAPTETAGISQNDLLNALHVQTNDGRWYSGPDAFAAIYTAVGLDRMAALWGSRRWRWLVNVGYRSFVLFRRVLVAFGGAQIVRWLVRREARMAAERARACRSADQR